MNDLFGYINYVDLTVFQCGLLFCRPLKYTFQMPNWKSVATQYLSAADCLTITYLFLVIYVPCLSVCSQQYTQPMSCGLDWDSLVWQWAWLGPLWVVSYCL